MEAIQTTPQRPDDSRCAAITRLIDAVAEQQEALARILEAEHDKIRKATQLSGVDVDDLVEIDTSAERMLSAITRLELAIQLKLDLFSECLCPGTPCPATRTTCGK
ncbi:MAG: hypothetical protein Q4F81_10635 [Eubacteriales bacterium]|nr:hypothetical protein [Eubacteriales bacterium]